MKQIGDYLYTINDIHQTVRTWKILEICGDRYRCQNKNTGSIREFTEGDTNIFDTKEEAMKVIKKTKKKKNSLIAVYFLIMAVIAAIILIIQVLN